MYDLLYEAWLKEKEKAELHDLPQDFYARVAEYVRQIKQEGRMLDQGSAKAKLIVKELANVKRLIKGLANLRFKKMVSYITSEKALRKESLTLEEQRMLLGLRPFFEEFQSFLKDSIQGKAANLEEPVAMSSKKKLLRFLKEVPAIVGADLKVYGPYVVEDVATLPIENARVLIKHGVAMEIETR